MPKQSSAATKQLKRALSGNQLLGDAKKTAKSTAASQSENSARTATKIPLALPAAPTSGSRMKPSNSTRYSGGPEDARSHGTRDLGTRSPHTENLHPPDSNRYSGGPEHSRSQGTREFGTRTPTTGDFHDSPASPEERNVMETDYDAVPGPSQQGTPQYTVTIRNAYGILTESEPDAAPVEPPRPEPAEEPAAIQRTRMPPIVVQATRIQDFAAFRRRVLQLCISEFRISYRKDTITVYTYCRDDHQNIFDDLKKGEINAFSHQHKKDKKTLFVLKDLPRGLSLEDVQHGLLEMIALPSITVTPMRKRHTEFNKDPYPYYVVHLPPDFDTRKINQIKTVLDFKVRFERLSSSNKGSQCHRCQQFGHGAEYCSYAPKCVKCVGDHPTKECPIIDKDSKDIKCTNCQGSHPASYRKCPAYKDYKDKVNKQKQSRASATVNKDLPRSPPATRPIARAATRSTGRTYAEATAQSATEPTRPREPSRPRPSAAQSAPANNAGLASDFQNLSNELRKLNELCDLRAMLAMVRQLNNRLSKDMDMLTKLQIMLDVTENPAYGE